MKNNNTLRALLGVVSVSLLISFQQKAEAAIYKCENAQGETYYIDKACPKSDKETQLDNIKDPVGGYIPPAFEADAETQRSKGVVVGEGAEAGSINNDSRDDASDSSSGGAGSDLNASTGDSSASESNESVIESSQSDSGKRTQAKGVSKKPLPTVPLKIEQVTKEARVKID